MTRYLSMRLLIIIPTLFATLMIVFLLGYLGPIDPVTILRTQWAAQGVYLNEEEVADLRSQYGLDRPFHEQFRDVHGQPAQGPLRLLVSSTPPRSGRVSSAPCPCPVNWRWAYLVIMAVVGIPLGVMLAARFHNTWLDYIPSSAEASSSGPFLTYVLVPVDADRHAVLWLDVMNVPRGWKGIMASILFCRRRDHLYPFACQASSARRAEACWK